MKLIGEIFTLALLRVQVLRWNYLQQKRVQKLFYGNSLFAELDKSLKKLYRFNSPFKISKQFLLRKGEEDIHCYGETPLTTLDLIAKEGRISENDHFLELGSGISRGLFFLSSHYGCKATGIEWVPEFVLKSYDISKSYPSLDLSFFLSDMTKASFEGASFIYLYGTCLPDEVIEALAHKMKKLPSTTKIVTVSYPLSDYLPSSFHIHKKFEGEFNWGSAEIFIQSPIAL